MDKLLEALTKGNITLDPENAKPTPLKTRAELEKQIRLSKRKQMGRKPKLYVEVDGEIRTLRQWADFMDLNYSKLYYNYNKGLRGRELLNSAR
jgi:hypothetical protein